MTKRATGLEEVDELARLILRWPALRSIPGDEVAYEFARAVRELHSNVRQDIVEIECGLKDISPLIEQIVTKQDGGRLFDEARALARRLEAMKGNSHNPTAK